MYIYIYVSYSRAHPELFVVAAFVCRRMDFNYYPPTFRPSHICWRMDWWKNSPESVRNKRAISRTLKIQTFKLSLRVYEFQEFSKLLTSPTPMFEFVRHS